MIDRVLSLELKNDKNHKFSRLTFFIAVVIVHECCHFLENKKKVKVKEAGVMEEDGEEFETQLLGGVLDLNYETLELYIETSEHEMLKYSSPQAENMIQQLSMKKATTAQNINLTPVTCNASANKLFPAKIRKEKIDPLIPLDQLEKKVLTKAKMRMNNKISTHIKGKVNIQVELTNLNEFDVSVPRNLVPRYFNFRVFDDKTESELKIDKKCKSISLGRIEPQVQLAPNQTHCYETFSLNTICYDLEESYLCCNWKLQSQFKGCGLENLFESNVCVDNLLFTSASENDNSNSSCLIRIPHNITNILLRKTSDCQKTKKLYDCECENEPKNC